MAKMERSDLNHIESTILEAAHERWRFWSSYELLRYRDPSGDVIKVWVRPPDPLKGETVPQALSRSHRIMWEHENRALRWCPVKVLGAKTDTDRRYAIKHTNVLEASGLVVKLHEPTLHPVTYLPNGFVDTWSHLAITEAGLEAIGHDSAAVWDGDLTARDLRIRCGGLVRWWSSSRE